MEVIVRNKNFEDLFITSEFLMNDCVFMPVLRPVNDEAEQGIVYYFNGFLFCESVESQDFFIMKIIKTADQFTQEECDYIRDSKGLPHNEGVNAIDAYITGFKDVSPFTLIYDSRNINEQNTQELLDAVNILQEFAIDNNKKQIDVEFKNNIIKISDIKE